MDVALSAGPNRLAATGAFGRPEDRLNVRIDAPRLAPFGIDGALRGRLDLAETLQRPSLAFDLAVPRLALPDVGTLSGLTLQGGLAGESDSPLDLELALERFTRPGEDAYVQALKARVSGSNRAHRLEIDGAILASGQRRQVRLAAEGGLLDGRRWLGQLRELRLAADDGRPRLALRQASPRHRLRSRPVRVRHRFRRSEGSHRHRGFHRFVPVPASEGWPGSCRRVSRSRRVGSSP